MRGKQERSDAVGALRALARAAVAEPAAEAAAAEAEAPYADAVVSAALKVRGSPRGILVHASALVLGDGFTCSTVLGCAVLCCAAPSLRGRRPLPPLHTDARPWYCQPC